MDLEVKVDSIEVVKELIEAKLEVRPILITDKHCSIRILNVEKINQSGLIIFPDTVYKHAKWSTMFTASEPNEFGITKIVIVNTSSKQGKQCARRTEYAGHFKERLSNVTRSRKNSINTNAE